MSDAKAICPGCGTVVTADEARFCPKCGRELGTPSERERMLQPLRAKQKGALPHSCCPFCGDTIVSNAVICLKCGRDLRTGRTLYNKPPATQAHDRIGKAILTVLVLISLAVWLYRRQNRTSTIERSTSKVRV